MVACAALLADAAAAHALHDHIVLDLQLQHLVDADAHGLNGLGLRDGAGHTVQDETIGTVCLRQTILQNADDDLIGHQRTGVHEALGFQAHLGAFLHSRTQDVAGADGRNVQLCADDLCLCALAGARCAQQNQIHRMAPFLL